MKYEAGIFEQSGDVWKRVTGSRHSRLDLAEKAARRYQRKLAARTGGSRSWDAWYSDAGRVYCVQS
jgi:hypothetical protein